MASTTTTADAPAPQQEKSLETCVELGKRAFALRKFEEAVEQYATALELSTEKYGDGAPESADLLFLYGKALLENAISQAGVMGKEETEDALKGNKDGEAGPSSSKANGKGPVIEFSGDEDDEEDEAVDLFAANDDGADAEDKGQEEEQDGEEGGEEPEDDFNAAWDVLDLARALYMKEDTPEAKLKLADTYIALGDVSLETEKFEQAATDYTAGIQLKSEILPFHSRQIAEAQYKLSMVLDLTPGKLAAAIEHAEKALQSVQARLDALNLALEHAPKSEEEPKTESAPVDVKGKGKASGMLGNLANDSIEGLKKEQIEAQIKEFEELKGDLTTKVDDLKTVPEQAGSSGDVAASAPDAANQALDDALNPSAHITTQVVNDLSSMVKKKKKPTDSEAAPATNGITLETNGASAGSKRKADEEVMDDSATTPTEKKAKLADGAVPVADAMDTK